MANFRRGRINEEMAKEITEILRTVKDPRVTSALISITGVDCTPDLKFAKVYYSSIGGKDDDDGVKKGLASANGYIRTKLAQNLNLRQTPELKFIRDTSIEHGAYIEKLLNSVSEDLKEKEDTHEE